MRITWRSWRNVACALLSGIFGATPAGLFAQRDSVTVVAGPRYAANELQEALLGRDYRDLWTTPVRVPVLDLDRFAGGLTPVRKGGNLQTLALRFRGADEREYNFRSVDKELTPALPPYARETFVDWLRQDQTSAQHPAATVVATALLESVGVLTPGPQLVALPDVAKLGQFREQFGGLLGTIEVHANEGEGGTPGFAGASRVANTETLLEHLEEDPDHQVDSREYLKARLMDMLVGDWDRHGGQWRWARYDRDGAHRWVPIPEDRDYAFVDYDGLVLETARKFALPRLIIFEEEYPSLIALMANSMALNRRLLAGLSRPTWDSVAVELQTRLTDNVIDSAVRAMPPAYYEKSGAELARLLKVRRDRLRKVAGEYYELLAESAEIHATDKRDRAQVVRNRDGSVEVRLYTQNGREPYYQRTFFPAETYEIRLFAHGGDDQVRVSGDGGSIVLRVIGGGGDDLLEDRGRGPTVFYDERGDNQFVRGPRTRVDERPYQVPTPEKGLLPSSRPDWGDSFSRFVPWADWRPIAGLAIGGGPAWTRYGFRHDPYESWSSLRALYAPGEGRFALEYEGDYRRENSAQHLETFAIGSNMEATRFAGFGNDTPELPADGAVVWLRRLAIRTAWAFPISSTSEVAIGPSISFTDPEVEANSPAAELAPLGTGEFGQAGAYATFEIDTRDDRVFPRNGFRVEADAEAYPPVWDVDQAFGGIGGTAATYLPIPVFRSPVLALRAGGRRMFGDFPFYEAAFLGGSRTLRGYSHERFAGDAALFGNAEVRVPLTPAKLILRGTLGVSAFADAGRVYVGGESPGGWHTAAGGAVWFATPLAALSLNYANGEDGRIYLRVGLPF